jgi:hypothetical protein
MSNILRIVNIDFKEIWWKQKLQFLISLASSYIQQYKRINCFCKNKRRRGASPAGACRGGGRLQQVRDVVTGSGGLSNAGQKDEDLPIEASSNTTTGMPRCRPWTASVQGHILRKMQWQQQFNVGFQKEMERTKKWVHLSSMSTSG